MEFNDPPWHFGTPYAGQTLDWMSPDNEENFNKLIQNPQHKEYFKEQGWLEPGAITYKINNYGFRCEEFQSGTKSILALGCSYTIGIGLPIDATWPALVGKELGLTTYTLAWGGVSSDTCYRLAEYWIPRLKPELVVMLSPPKSRVELLTIQNNLPTEVFLPSSESSMFTDQDIFLKNWFANEENANISNRKNRRALNHLCYEHNIRCLTYDAHDFMACSREEVGYARDYMHAGPIAHRNILNQVLKDYHG